MKLVVAPDDALKKKCRKVERFDEELRDLVDAMLDVMYTYNGIGIAAPQVGSDLCVIVVDLSAGEIASECRVMINPELLRTVSSTFYLNEEIEGCLSLPDQYFKVTRCEVAKVRWQTLDGQIVTENFSKLAARVVQHEMDHLNGVLLNDIGSRATLRG
jgi:peptide deformylase